MRAFRAIKSNGIAEAPERELRDRWVGCVCDAELVAELAEGNEYERAGIYS